MIYSAVGERFVKGHLRMSKDRGDEQIEVRMTLGEHLEDLRRRIIYALIGLVVGMVVALCFGKHIIAVIQGPYVRAMKDLGRDPELAFMSVTTAFVTYLKIALAVGLIISAPWVFYQFWMFVSAGLYPNERKYVLVAVPFSAVLFVGGALFFLFVISDYILSFFLGFGSWLGLKPIIRFQSHVSFMTNMMVVFGLGFQTPLLVLILGKMGLVTPRTLGKYRKHVIVAIVILAAVVTSPSPIDQIALAIPMWLLYELGVLLVYLLVTRKQPQGEQEES